MLLKKKNIIWNFIGATTNALTSLVFIFFVSRINGTDEAGIFSYGFATAIIIFCFANYITRPYQVTDITEKFSDSDYINLRIITCILPIIFIVLFCFSKQYSVYKSAIIILLCIFRITEAFCETIYAIIQKRSQLYKAGISMTVRAVGAIVLFFIIDYVLKFEFGINNQVYPIIAIIFINIIVCIFYDMRNARSIKMVKTAFSSKKMVRLLCVGFFNFAFTLLNSIIINVSRYPIDDYCDNKTQAIFGYILMPATVMCLLGQYIVQPVLTEMSQFLKEKNYEKLKSIIIKVNLLMLVFGLAVIIVANFLEEPVLSLVFGINLRQYKTAMMIIIVGSVMYGIEVLISYILVTLRITAIQAAIFALITAASAFFAYKSVPAYGIMGASVVYSLSMLLLAVALAAVLIIKMNKCKKEWKIQERIEE